MMIVRAEEKDFIGIMFVYKACVKDMNINGLFNWNTAYPSATEVLEGIKKGEMYLYRENQTILGVMCLNEDQPEEYNSVKWQYEGRFMVVHRLAVHPGFRNRNIGGKLMRFAEKLAREKKYSAIRLDAITANPAAMKLYQKAGYKHVGTIHFAYQQDPFMCMELNTGDDQK